MKGDQVIYQTQEIMIHHDAQQSIFDETQGVWKCDEALSQVFDISSQSKQKLSSQQRNKIVKI